MRCWSLWFGLCLSYTTLAQENRDLINTQLELTQDNIENLGRLEYQGEAYADLRQHPIKINFATAEELAQLELLNIFQISNLLHYREQTGAIYTHYELAMIKGFDRSLIEELMRYLDFTTERTLPQLSWEDLSRTRHEIILRNEQTLQKRAGYHSKIPNAYLGSPVATYLRYRGKVKDLIHLGFSFQKDAGEKLFAKSNAVLFDHTSAFVAFKGFGRIKYWVVGDYQISFSQGLSIWSGGGIGGPGNFASIKKYARGISAYAGAEETRFLRGSAIDFQLSDNLNLQAFVSYKPIDARLIQDSLTNIQTFTGSLISTGLHRTETEIKNKGTNQLLIWGGQAKWRHKNLSLSLSTVDYQFRNPIPLASSLYARYRFSGFKLNNYSLEANIFWLKYNFFMELAADNQLKMAAVAGVENLLADGFRLSICMRYLDLRYQSFYSALPTQTSASGERGLYLGVEWEIGPMLKASFSAGHYQTPWLSYRIDAPSAANHSMLLLDFSPKRSISLQGLVRIRNDYRNHSEGLPIKQLIRQQRLNLRTELRYQHNRQIQFSWRLEKSMVFAETSSTSLLMYQDVALSISKFKLDLKARIALIDGMDYSSRIYAYEADLLYKFSIPAYHGQALRTYLIIKWQASDKVSLQSKIGLTAYFDRRAISSGLQQIDGRHISNIALQMRIKI